MDRPPRAISFVWLFALAGLGTFFPFYSLYLKENAGLSGVQLGIVLATLPAVGIAAQPFWGIVADRTGLRARVLTVLCFGAAIAYTTIGAVDGFLAIFLATALLAAFSTPLIPTCVSVTLAVSGRSGPHAFGRIRVWGTVGFLMLVASFPWLLDLVEGSFDDVQTTVSEPALGIMFPLTGAMLLAAAAFAWALPRTELLAVRSHPGDWRRLLAHGPFLRVLAYALVGYLCLQGPMGMFAVFVRANGGSIDAVSRMWMLMVSLEIPLIAMSGATLARIGPRGLLGIGVLAGGIRWTVCGLAPSLTLVYVSSLLHGVTVAGLVVGGPLYVEAVVPERLRSTGQGILAMAGVSIGGIGSNLAAGWLLDHVGADAPYLAGGIGALVLVALLPVILPPARRLEVSDGAGTPGGGADPA